MGQAVLKKSLVLNSLAALLLILVPSHAGANSSETASGSTTATVSQTNQSKSQGLSLSAGATIESGLEQDQVNGSSITNRYRLGVGYALGSGDRLSLASEFENKLQPIETFEVSSLSLGLRLDKVNLGKDVTLAPGTAVSFPVNEENVQDTSYLGSLSASVIVVAKLLSGVSLSYRPDIKLNNHQFTTTATNQFNTWYSVTQSVDLSADVLSGLSLSVGVANYALWDYNQNRRSQTLMSQEISWQMQKEVSLSIGHANFSSNLASNGKDQNFDFFNQANSVVYASLSVSQ